MALGIIFRAAGPKRAMQLEEYVERHGEFSDTVSAPDLKTKQRAVALVSFDGAAFAYAALAVRGHRVATAKHVIRFTRLVDLAGVTADDLRPHIAPGRMRTVARFLAENGGILSQETWTELKHALKRVRPDTAAQIGNLEALADSQSHSYQGKGYETVAQEKDAFLLATEIFGIERRLVSNVLTPPRELAPFLEGLPKAARIEDIMIQKDKATFGD